MGTNFKTFLLSVTILCGFVGCKEKEKAGESMKSEKRPNFLFVLVDDQSPFDLKTYDPNSILETPTINKLAENPEFANKLEEMETLLLQQMTALGDPHRLWDQPKRE